MCFVLTKQNLKSTFQEIEMCDYYITHLYNLIHYLTLSQDPSKEDKQNRFFDAFCVLCNLSLLTPRLLQMKESVCIKQIKPTSIK